MGRPPNPDSTPFNLSSSTLPFEIYWFQFTLPRLTLFSIKTQYYDDLHKTRERKRFTKTLLKRQVNSFSIKTRYHDNLMRNEREKKTKIKMKQREKLLKKRGKCISNIYNLSHALLIASSVLLVWTYFFYMKNPTLISPAAWRPTWSSNSKRDKDGMLV